MPDIEVQRSYSQFSAIIIYTSLKSKFWVLQVFYYFYKYIKCFTSSKLHFFTKIAGFKIKFEANNQICNILSIQKVFETNQKYFS